MIQWDEQVQTGVQLMDHEHHKLINMINALEQVIDTERDAPIEQILQGLTHYATLHFEHEEALFRKSQWPGLESHQTYHAQFREQVVQFTREGSDPQKLHAFLKQWLLE